MDSHILPLIKYKGTIFLYVKCIIISFTMCLNSLNISAQHNHEHNGLQHWEIPSKNPDRIILTFLGDPATSRAVTWRTDSRIKNGFSQISEATVNSNFTENTIRYKAITEPFDLGLYKTQDGSKYRFFEV